MSSLAIRAVGLVRVFPGPDPVTALDDVSLDVAFGQMVAVMGPSGSGKTTLLQLLGGLDAPTSGSVVVDGRDVAGTSRSERASIRRALIGYVFQAANLIPSLTAVENVALPMELDGVPGRAARPMAAAALASVGLHGMLNRLPDQLSGGQQQRIALARALIGARRVLLADEPTGELDSANSREVMTLLRERVDGGAAAVVVTHDPLVAAWADRVIELRDGRIVDQFEGDNAEGLLVARRVDG